MITLMLIVLVIAVIAGAISIVVLIVQLDCVQTAGEHGPEVGDLHIRCSEIERKALLNIKQDIVDNYGYLSSWITDEETVADCCKWSRIQCNNRTGHVVMLDLSSERRRTLRGWISTSLLELRHLNHLDLSVSAFKLGRVQNSLSALSELRYLNLSRAGLAGTFPYQIGNISSLYSLDISENDLTKVENLEWLSRLSSLKYLNMNHVNLSMAVNWLQEVNMLPYLRHLSLYSCSLHDASLPLPSHFNLSRSLLSLDISANPLSSSAFSWLFNISTNLLALKLSRCKMHGPIPDAFSNMTSLSDLDLSYNQFEGALPKSMGSLCSLQRLDLSGNSLTQPLGDLTNDFSVGCSADALELLSLVENKLTGQLPDFSRFLSLKVLYLRSNQINGPIPDGFGHFPSILNLDLSSNKLEGVVTESHLSNFSKLERLDLSLNYLAVNLSSNWIPPFQLSFIGLSSCKLGPQFPNWLQWQNNIIWLDISNNGISDVIPSWFSELSSSFNYLNFSHNQISGMLPVSMLNSVVLVDLHSNQFKGPLPHFSADTLILDLSRNMFSGSISSVCNITNGSLFILDFSNNLLSGSIPDCWTSMVNLRNLGLSNNNLSGEIPSSIGSLEFLQSLNLHNNMLSGGLPLSLQNSSIMLEFIDVGENRLSGEIPSWIGEGTSHLMFLSLRSNSFHGSIPLSLCHLSLLRVLDLSHNSISGAIPSCFSNFTVMAQNNNSREHFIYDWVYASFEMSFGSYVESTSVIWKGRPYEFGKNLGLLKIIDLSSNSLSGNIPEEMATLLGLVSLNLSRNNLNGTIPGMIGDLTQLQSLDFSRNHLSGTIPASLANLSFLQYLDLSNNSLSGKIPSGTQLQGFNDSVYGQNPQLCGPPLAKKCQEDETPRVGSLSDNDRDGDDNWHGISWFYIGAGMGFIVGFWGVCLTIVLNSSWRFAYFRFMDSVKDRACVMTVIYVTKLMEMFGI